MISKAIIPILAVMKKNGFSLDISYFRFESIQLQCS